MNCPPAWIPVFLLALPLSFAAAQEVKPPTPAEQFRALAKEFNSEGFALRQCKTNDERELVVARVEKLTDRLLKLAEDNPKQSLAMDALVQVVIQEIWMQNNTLHPGRDEGNAESKAIALLLADHVGSERAGEACRRMSYGFRQECETFMRRVLKENPHRDARGLACLRLAQYLNARLQRLELMQERPEMAERYDGLFGREFMTFIRGRDSAAAHKEVEDTFAQAARDYADVKIPYGGTVGEKAQSELYEIRNLTIGKVPPEIEGDDQDGRHFKLSDYRGKVVLLYFWSEY